MRSLRGRLTLWLLLGTGLLLAAGGLLLDRVISLRLLREFDAALIEQAKSLQATTEQQDGTVSLEFSAGVMPEFAPGEAPDYFQLWLGKGTVLARSPSLGTRDLPHWSRPAGHPRFVDLVLPDGRPGRQVEISYRPQIELADETISPAPPAASPSRSGSPTAARISTPSSPHCT